MATTKAQRYGILTILIVTVVGTVGSFAVMILTSKSSAENQAKYQTALNKYTEVQKGYQAKVQAQADELSGKYYDTVNAYESRPAKFDINSVKDVGTEDLVAGDGEEITGATAFAAYYIGWDANGRIFDQSVDTSAKKLKSPLPIDGGLDKASLIEGWKTGMKGMRIGGIRLVTIPSDKAYGASGQTDSNGQQTIAPNMPLKFIVMAIPQPAAISQPDTTKLLQEMQEARQ
ncbi:MAG TPA: FKBP-type peptidyl-prolyl cis-trans isomerase [Candidatus Saccharimonadales bacterium]|nr:FKBP-type peptidyl-prolyl cis-trans isomerase [Candidatus Saccharimonadales bacterium]